MTLKKTSSVFVIAAVVAVITFIFMKNQGAAHETFTTMPESVKVALIIWLIAFINAILWFVVSCYMFGKSIAR